MAGEGKEIPINPIPEKSSQSSPEPYRVSSRVQSKLQEVFQWFKNRGGGNSSAVNSELPDKPENKLDLPDKVGDMGTLLPESKGVLSRLRPGHVDWANASKPRTGPRPFDMNDVAEMQRRGMTPEEYARSGDKFPPKVPGDKDTSIEKPVK